VTLASHTEEAGLLPDGTQELQLAQRYLDGRGVPHDPALAATLLWKAVGKQNARADILLADLYMQGDGVAKSCDQARLLLVAATEKSAPGAAERLRSLESGGCR
jgi:TPR repeat protein